MIKALLTVLLILNTLTLPQYVLTCHKCLSLDIQLPPGQHHTSNATIYLPLPTKTLFWIIVKSLTSLGVRYELVINSTCELSHLSGRLNALLRGFGDRGLVYGVLNVPKHGCTLIVKLLSGGELIKVIRLSIVNKYLSARIASVYLPTTYLGDPDPRREPFTLVESNPSPILRFLGAIPNHMLLGYLRVNVVGSRGSKLLLVGFINDRYGRRAPISSTVLEVGSGEPYIRATMELNCLKPQCSGYLVLPLWSLKPFIPPGDYVLVLKLYIPGTSKVLSTYVHKLRIKMLGYGDIVVPLVVASLGIALLPITVLRGLRSSRSLAYAGLTAAAIMTLSRFPGLVIFRLASILGPFDWVIYSPVTTGIYYALLAVAGRRTNNVAVPGVAVIIEWLLTVLILGSGNIVLTSLWALTTFAVVVTATALSKYLGWGLAPLFYALARAVDAYADINIYAYAYRLFYAPWYIATYSLGTALVAGLGVLAGLKGVEGLAKS